MKKHNFYYLLLYPIMLLSSIMLSCGSSNKLVEYDFRDNTIAGITSGPLGPSVHTDTPVFIDRKDIFGSFLRLGTTIAKEIEIEKLQARLDSAMSAVNVPEEIKNNTLSGCSDYFHFRPVDDKRNADFLFDFFIKYYGIDAQSYESNVFFKIEIAVYLIDNKTGVQIWKTSIKDREPMTSSIFSPESYTAGNVLTALMLSRLTVEELYKGFQYLAEFSADRIINRLKDDFLKSRNQRYSENNE
ncbi:hypothetical protein ACFL4T_05660 [candidate division KSB1 bacterium]